MDATIVRIMKSRRIVSHLEIVDETIKLCEMFQPDGQLIKKRIAGLIDRDYMKRDEKEM